MKIQIRVVDETEKGMPPLTPDEKRQVCDIENILEGRQDAAQPAGAGDALKTIQDDIRKVDSHQADATAETHRLLYRGLRKLDGVPPMVDKIRTKNKTLSKAVVELMRKVPLSPELWETYFAHWQEGKTQTQIAVDRGLPKKDAYKINRECMAIKNAFIKAGEPIPEKLTRHNADMDEDGTIYKKPKGATRPD